MNVLSTPFGSLKLRRWPSTTDRSLRAWDAADELLIKHVHESIDLESLATGRLLICNDAHGALSCALHSFAPTSWSDSLLALTALKRNWKSNNLPGEPKRLESTNLPVGPLDVVLIKVPKTLALLDDQLAQIRPLLHPNSVVVATCMLKYLNNSSFALFEKHIGAVQTSLAVKKARLLFSTVEQSAATSVPAHPSSQASKYPDRYTDQDLDLSLLNYANVFCRDHVDIGSRLFIENMHMLPQSSDVLDLACGNGILGLCVQRSQPQAKVTFVDESYHAIASARENYASMFSGEDVEAKTSFLIGDGLEDIESLSLDLIVCNPPFHIQHALTADTTLAFIKAASRCLRYDGQLWIVANKNLPYQDTLKRYFKKLNIKAQNRRFAVYCASDPKVGSAD